MHSATLRPLLAAGLWLAATVSPGRGDPPAEALSPGALLPRVACADDPGQSYALYLPAAYTAERAWPIVYCFDPGARGRQAVERFQAAAESTGTIIAGSNNSRNGPWPVVARAAAAMIRDTHRRLRLDDRRLYAAGCSGGARAACVTAETYGFAGVVACAGGFADSIVPARVSFAFFGTVGRADFNYGEMRDADAALEARGAAHHLAVFDGGHEWLPAPLALDALDWLQLQAMRSGRMPRDNAFIEACYRRRLQAIAASGKGGETYAACLAAVSEFAGLVDTAGPAAQAATLKNSKPVRQYLKAERKAREQEERWRDRLRAAIEQARHPTPPPTREEIVSQLRRQAGEDDPVFGDPNPGQAEPELGRRPQSWARAEDDWSPPRPAHSDRYAELRSAVRSLQRQAADNVAARRVLDGAFIVCLEEGRALVDAGNASAGAENLELAAIIRPEAPAVAFEMARAAALRGDRAQAREHLKAALAKGYRGDPRIEQLAADLAP